MVKKRKSVELVRAANTGVLFPAARRFLSKQPASAMTLHYHSFFAWTTIKQESMVSTDLILEDPIIKSTSPV
jgi:hypothetical protein